MLVQAAYSKKIGGVWHKHVGGHNIQDIQIVTAFDIDKRKIGTDLTESIFREPNVTPKFAKVPPSKITVNPGIMKDEVPPHLQGNIQSKESIVEDLKKSEATIALNLIPSGMQKTSLAYANECLDAGVSVVNATPAKLATNSSLSGRFGRAKLIIAGDDLMSQFGGTAFHKGILDFINSRGIRVDKSYQLDVGGGNETLNTISEEIKLAKRDIKTESISAEIPYKFATVAGTTDYVDYLGNNRTSYFWISGSGFFDSDVKIDVYLRTNDGANSANVLFDVVRAVSYSMKRKKYGAVEEICDYGFKRLPKPVPLHDAHREFMKKFMK